MLAKPTLAELLAILPNGVWPVLRDGIPYGTVNNGEFRSDYAYAYLYADWIADAEEAEPVYKAKTLDNLKEIVSGTRPHGDRFVLTDHVTFLMGEWDTSFWVFYEV